MKKKTGKRRIRLIHVFLSCLFIYVGIIYYNQNQMLKELEAKKDQKLNEIKSLELEIEDLNLQIENGASLEFVERIARDDLGMVKPREIIYIDKNKAKKSAFKSD